MTNGPATRKKRTRRLLIIAAVDAVLIGLAVLAVYQPRRTEAEQLVAELRAACQEPGPITEWLVEHRILKEHKQRTLAEIVRDLGRLGEGAVPPLLKALEDRRPMVRGWAAAAFSYIGPGAKDAVPALTRRLGDDYSIIRREAAWALGKIGPAARDAVPELIKKLSDQEAEVRHHAAVALGSIGPAAKDCVPALQELAKDGDAYVAGAAADAICKIQSAKENEK